MAFLKPTRAPAANPPIAKPGFLKAPTTTSKHRNPKGAPVRPARPPRGR